MGRHAGEMEWGRETQRQTEARRETRSQRQGEQTPETERDGGETEGWAREVEMVREMRCGGPDSQERRS